MITIICSNRAYAILKVELARERIAPRYACCVGGSACCVPCQLGGAGVLFCACAFRRPSTAAEQQG